MPFPYKVKVAGCTESFSPQHIEQHPRHNGFLHKVIGKCGVVNLLRIKLPRSRLNCCHMFLMMWSNFSIHGFCQRYGKWEKNFSVI